MFKYLFVFVFLIEACLLYSEDWQLKKSTSDYKAYIKNGDKKYYRVEAFINKNASRIAGILTAYDDFPKIFKNVESVKILNKTDSTYVTYTILKTIWPLSKRDIALNISVEKYEGGKYVIISEAVDGVIPEDEDMVRINDFREQINIDSLSQNRSKVVISGRIYIGDLIPDWVQNRIMLAGPAGTIEKLMELKE